MSPERIQLRRVKGYRKPEGAVVVSRPSLFGNPWTIHDAASYDTPREERRAWCVRAYRREMDSLGLLSDWSYVASERRWDEVAALELPTMADYARHFLRGSDLACWCPLDQPCHADVLLEIANDA